MGSTLPYSIQDDIEAKERYAAQQRLGRGGSKKVRLWTVIAIVSLTTLLLVSYYGTTIYSDSVSPMLEEDTTVQVLTTAEDKKANNKKLTNSKNNEAVKFDKSEAALEEKADIKEAELEEQLEEELEKEAEQEIEEEIKEEKEQKQREKNQEKGWTLEDEISGLIQKNTLIVFSKTYCPFSKKAKKILNSYTLKDKLKVVEVDKRADDFQVKAVLDEISGRSTFPNIFLKGKSLGGSQELDELHRSGELRYLLDENGLLAA
ncbi:thioredoxin-like protein [Mycotypha africana]|uniref:thioredoxin-like protein n=1 Tax=Mycotypha africana TaxID=64632 RepID=UPI0023016CBE|nr:thioredoxin-like protein [Mycotypha africana]KAI8982463.1 thioredoxin-like protein [Mycotypha africana]